MHSLEPRWNYQDSFISIPRLIRRGKFGFEEEFSESVFGAERCGEAVEGFEGPGDVEGGIVPENGTFSGRVVEIGGLVEDLGRVGEDKEAVGKAFRDPEELEVLAPRLSFEVEAGPFAEVGGVPAEIDGDVPDMPGEDADKFALGLVELVMQAAEHALDGKGLVVLDELFRKPGGGKC